MVFIADDLAAWLIGVLADAGRKKLTTLVFGSDQERVLRSAATAAVQRTAAELWPADEKRAADLALVVSEVFADPVPAVPPAGSQTLLEALGTAVAAQLAVLDDASLTDTSQSSADVLGVAGGVVAGALTGHLVREIVTRGVRGGPLFPLASQLNDDVTHLQGQRLEGLLGEVLTRLDQLTQLNKTLEKTSRVDASERLELALQRLSSDQAAIRVAAVQAMTDIAATVPSKRAPIAQILSTHLRTEAPGPGPDGDGTYLLPALRVRLPVAQAIVNALTNGQFSDLDLSHCDMCGANLANQHLYKADLRKVNLRCADLTGADLRGADLREANLTGAKVSGALLVGAKVTDAYLAEMDLTKVDLSEVVLVRVDMSRSGLGGVNFSGRDDLYYSKFRYADLTGANLSGAELRGAQFRGAKLGNADLTSARMVKADLEGAWLDGTRMRNADLAKADLTNAWLHDTDLRGADLCEANLTSADLSGTDLRGASLRDADLSQISSMRNVRIDHHTRDEGKLRYRSASEVHMEQSEADDDPLTSTP